MVTSADVTGAIKVILISLQINSHFYFMTGTAERARSIDVNAIADWYGSETCGAILGLHVFTGCDSLSSFKVKGRSNLSV